MKFVWIPPFNENKMNILRTFISLLAILCVSFAFSSQLSGAELKLIKTIGNDHDENYMFIRVWGGVISADNHVFVIDNKGHFIVKYDWNGRFIKKTGEKGKGPGSFLGPMHLDIRDKKLLFLDAFNFRVVEMDLDLNDIKYHKMLSSDFYLSSFHFIGKQEYIGSYISESENNLEFIKYTNLSNLTENTFFGNTPNSVDKKKIRASRIILLMPKIGIDRSCNRLVIGHEYPDSEMQFYISSLDGACLDSFSYTLDEDYRLPDFIRSAAPIPKEFTWIKINSILVYKKHYIVHAGKVKIRHLRPVENEMEKYFLIFDSKTKTLKHKLSVPSTLRFFTISSDGYLIGTDDYEEIPKVYIYKLDL
jgi:hypothetical protein